MKLDLNIWFRSHLNILYEKTQLKKLIKFFKNINYLIKLINISHKIQKILLYIFVNTHYKTFYLLYVKKFIPESATRSVMLRLWLPNELISWSMVKVGAGRFWLARVWFAVKLSLLPNGTSQTGPLACQIYSCTKTL